jgi:hypothetical protein
MAEEDLDCHHPDEGLPDDYENDDPGNCVIYSITFIYFLTKIVY